MAAHTQELTMMLTAERQRWMSPVSLPGRSTGVASSCVARAATVRTGTGGGRAERQ